MSDPLTRAVTDRCAIALQKKKIKKPAKELVCTVWPGPYSFDHTDDADKVSFRADFSEDGMDEIIKELNLRSPDYQEDPRYGIHDGSI